MSQNGLFYTLESFRRLEDFSSYTSCIKCFGKPIIPPLVTEGQKEELSSLREIAIKKEIDILNRRKCHLHLSKKVKEIYHMVAERLSNSNIHDNFISSDKSVQYENSALDSTVINESPLSLSTNIRSFENSLHVSMTKIPSSDICSTVHKGVIVCPNVSDWNNKHKNAVDFVTKPSTTPKEFCFHTANPECRLCQIEHPHGPFIESGVPYENFSIEQICKIPEDDQGSLAEDTEFESLPTVICGKKLSSQDTDNESNFTCLTQSTDLEKYMDCSIEYSSPDDLPMTAKSQMSSQLNMSSRSDDASSETLVNTESELTPCASTMPELSDYINEEPSEDVAKINIQFSSPSLDVHQRAYSVDSYMNIIKSCSKNLLMRKSRSEPCQTEISQLSDINSDTSFLSNSIKGNESNLVNLEQRLTTVNLQNHLANLPVSDGELSLDNVKDLEGKKELLKKKHIRTNSYTLDQPSSALILAHADCNCKDDSESVMSPHSCSSEKMTPIPSNPAFKKEKINIILPPTPDRDKYYPVLNPSISANYSETRVESSMSNINESEISTESDACSPSTNSIAANNEVNINSTKISPENGDDLTLSTGKNIKEPDEQILVKSSKDQTSLKGEELQVFLNEIIHDIQECQQSRVQKLLEEQNRQWLQLQEEFVEQERLLCAKLNLVGISPTNDNVSGNKSQFLSGDKNCSTVEQTSSNILICPKTSNFSKLNIQNVCDENLAETHKPLKINSSRIPNIDVQSHPPKEESLSISNSIDVSPHVSFGKNISNSLDSALHFEKIQPCASTSSNFSSNTKVNVSISEDSLEKSKYIHSNISSESSDHSVKFLKSQSFDNSIDRTGSMLSETSNPSVPTGDNFVLMNLKPSNSSVSFNYQAITSVNSSFANNRSEEQQISTQKICSRILPQPPSGASFLSKNSLHNNSSYLFDQTRSSALKQSDSYASTNVIYSNSEMQYSSDKSVDRTNFYPHAPQNTGKSSSTYQPSLHCDIMALNEKGEYSQSILSCQHLNDLQHLNNLQTFTDVNSCTSVALPIASDLSKSGLNEGSLTSIPFGAFKEKKDIFSDVFSDDMNLNTNEEIESEKSICVREHWFPLQDKIVMDDNLSVKNRSPSKSPEKNKISDQNHLHVLNSNGMVNSSVFDARTHSALPRKMFHKPMLSASSKSRSDSSIGQNVCKMYNDAASIMQAKAQKQISSISLTNLKRRQSREFIKDPNLLKKFEKLPALVKGYLTRRLFKTERVQGLMKTLEDTVVLIGKLSEELTAKGDSVSERDVDFHRQLLVQLMTTLHDIYDIFCTISIKERMKIISESRNLERKKKAAEMLKDYPVPVVSEKVAASAPPKRSRLSAATLKALERKRRTTIENRTYTIEDFKGCRPRIHSSTSSKSHSSPSRIYKSSIGLALKRKTTNARKTPHWK